MPIGARIRRNRVDSYTLRQLGYLLIEAADTMETVPLLHEEIEYWKKEHMDVLNQSMKHGEAMMGNMLTLLLKGGITPPKGAE